MFLRSTNRKKDGKDHRYFSIVENRRLPGGKTAQRMVLYLGEINDQQQAAWRKTLEVFDEAEQRFTTMSLFPDDRELPADAVDSAQVRLSGLELRRPRVFGSCWLACELWQQLGLDEFWQQRLPQGRETVAWEKVLRLLVVNRLLDPGSEFRVHRQWYVDSAMDELLETSFSVAEKDRLYRCLDRVLEHKQELFVFLKQRWADLFAADFEVLLYDLTSTYFEGEMEQNPKAKRGYSRDGRPDCLQLVIALVVTPDGLPLAYEVLPGNTADSKTLRTFLSKIEQQYGKARRVWVMDRGVPTEAVLAEMRNSDPPVQYLVGTPKGRLNRLEKHLVDKPWQDAREGVQVKLLAEDGELYVFAQSVDRVTKERAMRRRQMKWLWKRLRQIAVMELSREELLMKLGGARSKAPAAWRLVDVEIDKERPNFTFALNRKKLKRTRRREGRYLLRTNLTDNDPAQLWQYYVQLVTVEEAFRNLKGDLAIRPVFHHDETRIEAHIFIAFMAYCMQVTLTRRLHALAPGLTARSALDKFAAVQMIDVHLPTTDGREIKLTRYTHPEPELQLLIDRLKLRLPPQPPPRITTADLNQVGRRSEDLLT